MQSWVLICLLFVVAVVGGAIVSGNRDAYRVNGLEKYGAKDEMYAGLMSLDREYNKIGSFFFWLAKKRQNQIPDTKKRLLVWLNGGPGCSSMVGMMLENGPFTIHFGENGEKYDLKYNPYSWNEVADVLFVEQPIRVGFSNAAEGSPIVRNEDQIGSDFRLFITSFLVDFPEYRGVDLFLSGESYAGFYIPWIAEHIVSQQLVAQVDSVTGESFYVRDTTVDGINLVGAAIGNGVLDYLYQEPSYAEYAYSHGLIPLAAKQRFDLEWQHCLQAIERDSVRLTKKAFNKCNSMGKVLAAAGFPNEYNTATFIGYDNLIKPGSPFDSFFQDVEIQELLHVRGRNLPGVNFLPENYAYVRNRSTEASPSAEPDDYQQGDFYYEPPLGWQVCNDAINGQMSGDHPISAVPVLQFLVDYSTPFRTDVDRALDRAKKAATTTSTATTAAHLRSAEMDTVAGDIVPQGISAQVASSSPQRRVLRGDDKNLRVLLYSGEFDLNCNTLGTQHTLENNWWRGRSWDMAQRALWRVNGDVAGEYFTIDGSRAFSFLIVRNSGHLLPMDQPAVALEMIRAFLFNESLAHTPLKSDHFYRRDLTQPVYLQGEGPSSMPGSLSNNSTTIGLIVLVIGLLAVIVFLVKQKSGSSGRNAHYKRHFDAVREQKMISRATKVIDADADEGIACKEDYEESQYGSTSSLLPLKAATSGRS